MWGEVIETRSLFQKQLFCRLKYLIEPIYINLYLDDLVILFMILL